jgi:hypothetical protein
MVRCDPLGRSKNGRGPTGAVKRRAKEGRGSSGCCLTDQALSCRPVNVPRPFGRPPVSRPGSPTPAVPGGRQLGSLAGRAVAGQLQCLVRQRCPADRREGLPEIGVGARIDEDEAPPRCPAEPLLLELRESGSWGDALGRWGGGRKVTGARKWSRRRLLDEPGSSGSPQHYDSIRTR